MQHIVRIVNGSITKYLSHTPNVRQLGPKTTRTQNVWDDSDPKLFGPKTNRTRTFSDPRRIGPIQTDDIRTISCLHDIPQGREGRGYKRPSALSQRYIHLYLRLSSMFIKLIRQVSSLYYATTCIYYNGTSNLRTIEHNGFRMNVF